MNVMVVYDDTGRKSEVIADIIGNKGFADVVVKKKRLEEYYQDYLRRLYKNLHWRKIRSVFEYADILKEMELCNSKDIKILHCFSNYLISDPKKALLSFEKLSFVDEPYCARGGVKL